MGGTNDEDLRAFRKPRLGPAPARHHLAVDRHGHAGLIGQPALLHQRAEIGRGRLGWLVVEQDAHKDKVSARTREASGEVAVANGRELGLLGLPMRTLLACLTLLTCGLSAADSPMKNAPSSAPRAIIHTTAGDLTVEFWPEVAPKTVENFLKLAKAGFYNGTAFHRIIKGFMIQGGCPNTKPGASGMPGTGGPGYQIKAEFNAKPHVRGVLSMARSQHPDSAGSQFFVVHGDARFLDNQYTAFGHLVAGDEVLEAIATVPCSGPERSTPSKRIEITSVEVVGAAR